MTAYPRSTVAKALLALWLAACVAVLAFAFAQRHTHDTDVAFAYLMLVLTFPLGVGVAAVAGITFEVLHDLFGVVVPGGFVPNLFSWLVLVSAGYLRWFIALPWLWQRVRQSSNSTVERDARKSGARPSP